MRVNMTDAKAIEDTAAMIRDAAQSVIDACQQGKKIDNHAYNMVASGKMAQHAALLGILVVQHEKENE